MAALSVLSAIALLALVAAVVRNGEATGGTTRCSAARQGTTVRLVPVERATQSKDKSFVPQSNTFKLLVYETPVGPDDTPPDPSATAADEGLTPVLFVPGHLGRAAQADELAKALAQQTFTRARPTIALYAVDAAGGALPTALSAAALAQEVAFVAEAVTWLSKRHRKRVILIGHSMGGVVARAAACALGSAAVVAGPVAAVVAVNAPLARHPWPLDAAFSRLYSDVDASCEAIASHSPFALLSLYSGPPDLTISSELTLPPLSHKSAAWVAAGNTGAHLYPAHGLQDHNAILSCSSLCATLGKALLLAAGVPAAAPRATLALLRAGLAPEAQRLQTVVYNATANKPDNVAMLLPVHLPGSNSWALAAPLASGQLRGDDGSDDGGGGVFIFQAPGPLSTYALYELTVSGFPCVSLTVHYHEAGYVYGGPGAEALFLTPAEGPSSPAAQEGGSCRFMLHPHPQAHVPCCPTFAVSVTRSERGLAVGGATVRLTRTNATTLQTLALWAVHHSAEVGTAAFLLVCQWFGARLALRGSKGGKMHPFAALSSPAVLPVAIIAADAAAGVLAAVVRQSSLQSIANVFLVLSLAATIVMTLAGPCLVAEACLRRLGKVEGRRAQMRQTPATRSAPFARMAAAAATAIPGRSTTRLFVSLATIAATLSLFPLLTIVALTATAAVRLVRSWPTLSKQLRRCYTTTICLYAACLFIQAPSLFGEAWALLVALPRTHMATLCHTSVSLPWLLPAASLLQQLGALPAPSLVSKQASLNAAPGFALLLVATLGLLMPPTALSPAMLLQLCLNSFAATALTAQTQCRSHARLRLPL